MHRVLLAMLLWFAVSLGGLGLATAHAQEFAVDREPVVLDAAPPALPEGWQTVAGPFLEVYGNSESLTVLLELARYGSTSLPRLAETMGVPLGSTIHVVVAPTQKSFFALQPGQVPEWADGTAYPDRGWIYLRRPGLRGFGARPLPVVFDHELVHVLLGRAFAPQVPPRWLTEGLAQVLAGEYDPESTKRIARGMLGGGLLTMEELSYGFPAEASKAELAYAQSADFISWLQVEYGEEAIRVVVTEMSAGADIQKAIRLATGHYLEDVDRQWRSSLRGHGTPLWLSALGSEETFWGLGAFAAIFGLIFARRRIRRRMRVMAEQERIRDAWFASLWQRDDPAG